MAYCVCMFFNLKIVLVSWRALIGAEGGEEVGKRNKVERMTWNNGMERNEIKQTGRCGIKGRDNGEIAG